MKQGKVDGVFLSLVLILNAVGLIMIFSANLYTSTLEGENGVVLALLKQIVQTGICIGMMFLVSMFDYRKWSNKKLGKCLLIISIFFLIVVYFTEPINGARRWISIFGFTTLQPSEFTKLISIIYLAGLLKREAYIYKKPKRFFMLIVLPMAIQLILIIFEPSYSAGVAVLAGILAVLYFANVKLRYTYGYVLIGIVTLIGVFFTQAYRIDRITGEVGYQVQQSLLAIGSGGWSGTGLGNGKQKYLFLPELQNDFIFANIGEEGGVIGCLLVIILFVLLIHRGFSIGLSSREPFGYYYTCSVMFLIAYHFMFNIMVAVGFMPVTGIALPFISSGGSSSLMFCVMMGPILNLSKKVGNRRRMPKIRRTKQ